MLNFEAKWIKPCKTTKKSRFMDIQNFGWEVKVYPIDYKSRYMESV